MKRIVCLIFIFIVGAAGMLWADNKMQMVTYFPVPYVAYSQVNVSKQLDIGLGTVASSIYLGSARSNSAGLRSLYIGTANLNRGILSLNSGRAVVGNGVVMGSGSGVAQFDFGNNLRIGTLNNGYSIEADKMELEELNLFPERVSTSFPSCASTGAEGAPQISWQKLKLKDKEETFLVCGNVSEVKTCTGNPPTEERVCGCPGSGGIEKATYTCVDGEWVLTGWGECSNPMPEKVSCHWTPMGNYTVQNFTSSRWEAVLLHIYSQAPDFEGLVPSSDPTGGDDYESKFNFQSDAKRLILTIHLSKENDTLWKNSLLSSIENQTNSWADGPDTAPMHYVIYSAASGTIVALDIAVCMYCP